MYNVSYMWNLEKMIQINLIAGQKQRYRGEQMYGWGGEGMNWEAGIDTYTLLCIKQIANEIQTRTDVWMGGEDELGGWD